MSYQLSLSLSNVPSHLFKVTAGGQHGQYCAAQKGDGRHRIPSCLFLLSIRSIGNEYHFVSNDAIMYADMWWTLAWLIALLTNNLSGSYHPIC